VNCYLNGENIKSFLSFADGKEQKEIAGIPEFHHVESTLCTLLSSNTLNRLKKMS
jgi:hypothetical protein